jgi:hypothetical protein
MNIMLSVPEGNSEENFSIKYSEREIEKSQIVVLAFDVAVI